MPIRIPKNLPAQQKLRAENIFVMDAERAAAQDIRPIELGILNLMPNKIETEVQLLRLLSNTPLQINIDLIRINKRPSKNTPESHMNTFYHLFDDVAHKRYDGLIVTGAPVAMLPFEDIEYWPEIKQVFEWTRRHVQSTLYLCWAVHAAMYHFYGINRRLRADKLSGVYQHEVQQPFNPLVRGFDSQFYAPHSRYGEIPQEIYADISNLDVIATSNGAGAYMLASNDKRTVMVCGHPEYDANTLKQEYERDLNSGDSPTIPHNYFVNNDPKGAVQMTWRAHGSLLYTNWLNYYVYQTTPFDLSNLAGSEKS